MDAVSLNRAAHASSDAVDDTDAAAVLRCAIELVGVDFDRVRRWVGDVVAAQPQPAGAAIQHLVDAGGKGVRPLLTLLAARLVGGDSERATPLAVAAELVHDATLLHDDVIDDAPLRRGRATSRVVWGNAVSVLSGDLLFVLALRTVAAHGPRETLGELLETVALLVEGELIQLRHRGRVDMELQTYWNVVERKTASLFRWCARAGATAGGGSPVQVAALGRFAYHVGVAFQVRDDVLDLTADAGRLGKAIAADIAQGKLTLPLLLALRQRPELGEQLTALTRQPSSAQPAAVAPLLDAVRDSDGIEASQSAIQEHLGQALNELNVFERCAELDALRSVARALGVRGR